MAEFPLGIDVLPGTSQPVPAVMTAEVETLHWEWNTKAFLQRLKASRLRINAMLSEAGLDPTPAPTPAPAPTLPPEKPKLLSEAEAAAYSGLSKKRIRELVRKRRIKCRRFSKAPNAHMHIVTASIDEYLATNG